MTTVKEIEKAITGLPPAKLSTLRAWFEKFDNACWDHQIKLDAQNGKLSAIATKVRENYKKGKSKAL